MTRGDDRSPAERVGVLVKQAQAALHQRMDEALRPLGLSVPQYVCLQSLADAPGLTGSELARRAFVTRQATNVLLQGLERRGLLTRSEEPGPRRERATELTAEAHDLVRRARAAVAEVVDDMVAGLDADDVDRLESLLEGCRDALRPPAADESGGPRSSGSS